MSDNDLGHDELLLAVFRFKNQHPSTHQTEQFCLQLRDALRRCVQHILDKQEHNGDLKSLSTPIYMDPFFDDRQTPLGHFSPQDYRWLRQGWLHLRSLPSKVTRVGTVWTLKWYPEYASVLQAEQIGVATLTLRVVALDNFQLQQHFLPPAECVYSAVSTGHDVLACGTLENDKMATFSSNAQSLLTEAKQIRGSKRSSANDREGMGHQKTPQFLVAVLRTAMDAATNPSDYDTH